MKPLVLLLCGVVASLPACTTIENRRDLYSPQEVNGPYTRMLNDGVPAAKTSQVTTGSTEFKNVVR